MRRGLVSHSVVLLLAACAAETPLPTPEAPAWETVWIDEFEGEALDRSKWAPEESCWGGGNNERQCYTDRPENISVSEGVLSLKAREEAFTGPRLPDGMQGAPDGERTQSYTSGRCARAGLPAGDMGGSQPG